MEEANGEFLWIDEECVGYKCECGYDDLIIGIYQSKSNQCPNCDRRYHLVQTNIVYELGKEQDKNDILE